MARAFISWLTIGLFSYWLPTDSRAESLETVLMPGKVIEGHADVETVCNKCHARFKKSAQSGLCLDCHEDIARDVVRKQGHHGRITEEECRVCHTDHKGREMNIASVDEKNFDHRLTDFLLRGGHADPKVRCRDCHKSGVKFRDAPADCYACHRKDDTHKGGLGTRCADCHVDSDWKKTRFDHGKTKFALEGKHTDVPCKDCHRSPDYKNTPKTCVACHKKDDTHKARYGTKCESCHNDRDWKQITFDHDRDTKYPLRGKHRLARCSACHSGILYQEKLKTSCVACHKTDDDKKGHKGRYGDKCQSCHTEKDWSISTFDHDRDTKYPLRGKHLTARCDSCHTGFLYREKLQTTCFGCHDKDDKHKGQEGRKCESCHNVRDWKDSRIDHGLTRFPLLGKHIKVECEKCHLTPAFKDAGIACLDCHKKDDKHKFRLGPHCETCHNALDWKTWRFDHNKQSSYVLDGAHERLACEGCHSKPMPKKVTLGSACISCHDADDVHSGGFGKLCEQCHVTRSFKRIRPGVGGVSPGR